MIKSVIFATATDLIVTRKLDLNSRILNEGRKKRNTRKSRAQMIKVVGKKEDQICALIPNDGNQDQIIENLN